MTIPRSASSPEPSDQEAQTLALSALGWVLSDSVRADRLLALTGQTPDDLRAGLGNPVQMPAILGGVMEFLCAHEPDLVSAADALGVPPAKLAAVRERLP